MIKFIFKPRFTIGFVGFYKFYDVGRYYTFNILEEEPGDVNFKQIKKMEEYFYNGEYTDEMGERIYLFRNKHSENSEEVLELTFDEATEELNIKMGVVSDKKPFCVDNNFGNTITFLYPYSAISAITDRDIESVETRLYFRANDHKSVYNKMYSILEEKELPVSRLYDDVENGEAMRALVAVVNVFSYGL